MRGLALMVIDVVRLFNSRSRVFTGRTPCPSTNADGPNHGRRWLAQAMMTLAAWLVAFLTVLAISTLFRDELASLPLALRALVLSGVLVALMVNVVMPVVSVAIKRWLPPGRRAERDMRSEPLEHPPADRQTSSALTRSRHWKKLDKRAPTVASAPQAPHASGPVGGQ